MPVSGQGPFFFPPGMGGHGPPPGMPPPGGGGLAGKGGSIGPPGGQGLPTGAHQLVAHQNAMAQATPEVHLERAKANTEAMKAAHTVLKAHVGMMDRAHKTKADGLANLTKYWMSQAPRGVDPTGYARSMVGQATGYGRGMVTPRGVSPSGYAHELGYPRSRYSTGSAWDYGNRGGSAGAPGARGGRALGYGSGPGEDITRRGQGGGGNPWTTAYTAGGQPPSDTTPYSTGGGGWDPAWGDPPAILGFPGGPGDYTAGVARLNSPDVWGNVGSVPYTGPFAPASGYGWGSDQVVGQGSNWQGYGTPDAFTFATNDPLGGDSGYY